LLAGSSASDVLQRNKTIMNIPPNAQVVLWYPDEATYLDFKRVCSDRDSMFGISYAEWLRRGNEIEEHLKSQGGVFAKAEGTADEFVAWCELNSHDTTSQSRIQFAAFKLIGDGGER